MGFASKGVCVMGYRGCMGYEALSPANQLSGLKNVWNLREYGVCEPWVTRELTVARFFVPQNDGWVGGCSRDRQS